MKAYKKLMDGIATIEKIVVSVILVAVTALTFANVVVRKFTSSQFAFTEEVVINVFILLIMMGCALSIREGSMISLSLIFDRLQKGGKKVFVGIITIANLAFFLLLFKTGLDKVLVQMANGKRTFSLGLPEWVYTIFLPIGCFFLVLHTIEFFIDVMTDNAACVKDAEDDQKGEIQK